MHNISNILAKAKQIYNETVDQFIDNDEIGSDVTLYYPPTFSECVNCEFNQYSDKNIYRNGGPIPFTLGDCPMCAGTCQKEVEQTEVVRMRVYSAYNKSLFKSLGINIQSPSGDILSLFYLSDVLKVNSCNYALINGQRHKLSSEPVPYGFGRDRYVYAFWKRE
jgi:hypothetical protein